MCNCEALAMLRHIYLGSFSLDPEDIRSLSLGATGTLVKGQGSHDFDFSLRGSMGLLKASVHWDQKGSNPLSIVFYSICAYLILVP